jgi:tRNA 2-selenouridine synthase
MIERKKIDDFLLLDCPVFDVRSPFEFNRGHIPGAINLPLFSNEERAIVGKAYHQQGRDEAVKTGIEKVSVKMTSFIESVDKNTKEKKIRMHCWRGGMRSESMAWLMHTAGYHVYVLENGYKTFRNHIQKFFENKFRLIVIGGMTGAGKSEILRKLKDSGEQILDLEAIASHKGSVFGHLGQEEQPTTEHFENLLYEALNSLNPQKPIWIECESLAIGRIYIPRAFFNQMLEAPLYYLNLSRENRTKRLIDEYANFEKQVLIDAVVRISKRLGGNHTKNIIQAIESDNFFDAIFLILEYYDKLYTNSMKARDPKKITDVVINELTTEIILDKLLALKSNLYD